MNEEQATPLERIATGIGMALLLLLTVGLLAVLLLGGAPASRQMPGSNLGVVEQFYMNAANAISDAAPGNVSAEKKYRISGNTSLAPIPNKNSYGHADSPAQMTDIIAQAEKLLDGQSMYFSSWQEVYEPYGVQYYLDDSLLAITWKMPINSSMYTFSEVKLADASQFRRYLAGGQYGSGKLVYATEMAGTVHAVVASSGDYFEYRNAGIIVYNGNVYRAAPYADTCLIDSSGDLHFIHASQQFTMEQAQAYVRDNDINFSLAFGPILVENGQPNNYTGYPFGEIGDESSRAALCQMGKLHYLLVNASDEDSGSRPTMYEFARHVIDTGCQQAYALDGGQTTALVMNNTLVNRVLQGYQRKISDIIYFATAVPNS